MNEGHVRDATKMMDSRENLAAEASELVAEYAASGDVCDALYHGMLELLDRQAAITERETLHSHPMCAGSDTCHALNRLVGKHIELEAPETSDDSREKLEADVRKWFADDYYDDYYGEDDMNGIVARWLDRQAAIVERYWRGQVDALAAKGDQLAEANVGLRQQVGELTAELTKRDKGIARLKRRRDELERALKLDGRIRASQDAAIEEIARWRDEVLAKLENARQSQGERDHGAIGGEPDSVTENEDCGREGGYEWLVSRIEWYADECARLERLNAELREKLSDAIGHAWAIVQSQDLSAVDMEGEVADR